MKKLLIALTPLVAYVALATVPVASQAAVCKKFVSGKVPHYCANGTRLEEYPSATTEKTPTISWGTLSLGGTAGVTCKNAVGGNVWNPTVGSPTHYAFNTAGNAEQETINFATYECALPASTCPTSVAEARVVAENLPWPGIVREGENAGEKAPNTPILRLQSNKVRVSIGCFLQLGVSIGPGKGEKEGEPLCSSASLFECLSTSGGPEEACSAGTCTPEATTPAHPGEGENAGKLKLGKQGCSTPGLVEFEGPSAGNEGSGELEQEIPRAEIEGGNPNTKPGEEGRGTLKFQTNPSDIRGKGEVGAKFAVKAGTTGTLKACGFAKQELINTEE